MSTKIITGYTGDRTITSSDDAQIWQSLGISSGILPIGDQLVANMPSINSLTVASGFVAIQGHIGRFMQETFKVDTCANDAKRKDLCIARYTKNLDSSIESISLMLIKGVETSGIPQAPAITSGIIENGAAQVDLPLYEITLRGGETVLKRKAEAAICSRVMTFKNINVDTSTGVKNGSSGFKVDVTIPGVTSEFVPCVIPSNIDALKFSSRCESYDGYLRLYCKNNTFGTITIPTIILMK